MKKFIRYRFSSIGAHIVLLILIPIIALMLTEYYTHVPSDLTTCIFLVNLCVYYIIYLTFAFFTGRLDRGYSLATVFFMLFGLLNGIVMAFRSTPVVPWDIYSIRTALSVAGNYKLEMNQHILGAFAGFICLILLCSKLSRHRIFSTVRIAGTVIGAVCMFLYTTAIGSKPVIDYVGLDTTLFTPKVLYRNNGLATGFLGVLKFLWVERPEHYSTKQVESMIARYDKEETQPDEYPNVIVIMNEAFSDLDVYGSFQTNRDYMPFIHSLEENTWKGDCFVSVKGGNTANSEYEFLTGNSMAFVPAGSVPYQQYIKSEIPSLAHSLKEKGYQTVAIHPYNASGWNRNTVYPLLGFEEQIFKSDFTSPDTIRGYISDKEAFDKIIDLYEEKEEGTPLFAFEVTMQNHGGYSKEYADLSEEILLTEQTNQTTQVRAAEKYLTLVEKSDAAFRDLVEYFSEQDEKTVILMFGDHQPSDYITNVFARMHNLDTTAEETQNLGYIVPYVMWSNYDISDIHRSADTISLNYMNMLLMEMCRIPLTGYQKFESELYQTYHVITANQIYDTRNKLLEYDLDTDLMNEFATFSYNLLCDKKDKQWDFFTK